MDFRDNEAWGAKGDVVIGDGGICGGGFWWEVMDELEAGKGVLRAVWSNLPGVGTVEVWRVVRANGLGPLTGEGIAELVPDEALVAVEVMAVVERSCGFDNVLVRRCQRL